MLRKLIYIATCVVLYNNNVHAQQVDLSTMVVSAQFKAKQVIPPTPEAASLGKYGNVPVSLFTGTPNINIPLYQLSGNNISLPIQLNYNAGGFNPQEIAPWTGLGWSLSAGGVVTRSVNGNPDVASHYFTSPSPLDLPNQFTDPYGYYDLMDALRKGQKEAQPDVYYYNFAGHSGKFLVKPDGSIVKKEKNNYLITANVSTTTGSSITITDEMGIQYEFAEVEISVMDADDMSMDVPHYTYSYPSTWYLTRILSADGAEEIDFTYYSTSSEQYQYLNYTPTEAAVYEESIPYSGAPTLTGPISKSTQPPVVRTWRKYLQQISFKRTGHLIAYIDFESTVDQRQDLDHSATGFPGERLLNSIKVYTKRQGVSFAIAKQFTLNYGYFTNSSNASWDHKRLRLQSVQEIPTITGMAMPPPYTFDYNDDGLMPPLGTVQMDHWGFYNLGVFSTSLVPTYRLINGTFYITAENREPSLAGSSSYLINKITYPTGGYTSFEYELNQAIKPGTSTMINVGGVRIKRTMDYSFASKKALEKDYEYKLADGTTSGKTMVPEYFSSANYKNLGCSSGGYCDPCIDGLLSQKNIYTISATSVIGLGSVQGSHIGYSRVTEYSSDVNNSQPLGKTVYEYNMASGTWDSHDDYVGNGDLLKKSVYDNGSKLINEITNTYNYIPITGLTAVIPGIASSQDNKNVLVETNAPKLGIKYDWYMASTCANYVIDARTYKTKFYTDGWSIQPYEKQLSQQLVMQYDQLSNAYLTTTKKFTYGNTAYTLPTKIEQTTSNNETVVTEKKYPLDYNIPTSGTLDDNTAGIKLQKDKNIIGAEVETVQYRQNADGTNKRYINGMLTTYNSSIPYPSNLYKLEISAPLTVFSFSSTSGGVFSKSPYYKPLGYFIYSGTGFLLEQSKDQDVPTAYIWDYDGQYPIAEVTNAQQGQVCYTSFETDYSGGWTNIPNLSANRNLTTGFTGKYSYNLTSGNNITTYGLPSGRQYLLSYWSQSIYPVAITTDAGTVTTINGTTPHKGWYYHEHLLPVNTTSVTLSGNGDIIDELRLYPKNASMNTVAYDPGIGVISQCTANNQAASFEYDGLSRLVNVKDADGNIVKNFSYNFATDNTALTASPQSLFYSAEQTITKTKNDCTAGEGTSVVYVVPYGKYISSSSQAEADAPAIADRDNNSQAYANANGICLFWNTLQSQNFSKNDCLYEQGPSACGKFPFITYAVAAHTYSSLNSVTEANNLALAEIQANGQNYANTHCTCSCMGEGKKFINGVCETGTRWNSSSVFLGNGQYQCTYYYQFSDGTYSDFYTEITTSPCPVY